MTDWTEIRIQTPEKTAQRYVFTLGITVPGKGPVQSKIGIKETNFDIPHHVFWDSFLPLMFLSRNGGPLFNKPVPRGRIRADFPLEAGVARFFIQRARQMGVEMEIDSPLVDRVHDDAPTGGDVLLFGGGKDSRLLLGTLREVGLSPRVISARGTLYATDIPGCLCFETLNFSMPNRIVPALMLRPQNLYYGGGFPEVHLHHPWQQHYDISAYAALRATSDLLKSAGFDITLHAPQNVLPHNLTQRILADRYPDLHAGQISVEPHQASDKNLHVSLLRRYHGLPTGHHCNPELFGQMLEGFMTHALSDAPQFGFQNNREAVEREMRSIIFRLHSQGRISLPAGLAPPADWDAPWIDFIHPHGNPDTASRLMEIYRCHADDWPAEALGLPACLQPYITGEALPG